MTERQIHVVTDWDKSDVHGIGFLVIVKFNIGFTGYQF